MNWKNLKIWLKTKSIFKPLRVSKRLLSRFFTLTIRKAQECIEQIPLNRRLHAYVSLAERIQPKVLLISPTNGKKCGIAEFAEFCQLQLMMERIETLIVHSTSEALAISKKVPSVKSIVLQHEYIFFNEDEHWRKDQEYFNKAIQNLSRIKTHRNDVRISLIIHSLATCLKKQNDELRKINSKEKIADVFTTTRSGANFIDCNYIPLGNYMEFNLPKSIPSKTPEKTIGNFGIIHGARDVESHMQLCKLTQSRFLASHYCMDKETANHFIRSIQQHGFDTDLVWIDFCERNILIERLSCADIFYMPRVDNGVIFASGAIIFCMQLKKPIIVNHHACYEGLEDIVLFAETVEEAKEHINRLKNPKEYQICVSKIEKYLTEKTIPSLWKEKGIVNV